MAHILQDNIKVKEIYLANGNINGSNYLFMVFEDGTLSLDWCQGQVVQHEVRPILIKIGRTTRIEFGEPNLFGTRQILTFQDENGQLDKKWKKIM